MVEDAPEHWRIGQEGEDRHGCRTLRAGECVDGEDAAQELRPAEAARANGRRHGRVVDGDIFSVLGLTCVQHLCRWRHHGRRQWQTVPIAGAVGEDTVVADQVGVGCGDKRGEPPQERDGLEDDLGPTVDPGLAEAVADLPVRNDGEPLEGQRRP